MTPPRKSTPWDSSDPVAPLGDGDRQCTARSKRSGERCRAFAIRGGKVCRAHGGAAVQVRQAAQRRLAAEKVESQIRDAIAFEAREGVEDPLEQLALLASEALAMKEALAGRINALKTIRYSAHGSGTDSCAPRWRCMSVRWTGLAGSWTCWRSRGSRSGEPGWRSSRGRSWPRPCVQSSPGWD